MFGIYHWIALSIFAFFAGIDLIFRARNFPHVPLWRTKGVVFTFLYFGVTTYSPLLWDELLGRYQLVDGSAWPFWTQILVGFFFYEFLIYVWHRTMHNVQPIWRWLHQMHHSAERVDIWGAFNFHPFDMMGWALLGSCALVLGIGLSAEAALIVSVAATFCAIFQHSNLRTPRWLGYFITRSDATDVGDASEGAHGRVRRRDGVALCAEPDPRPDLYALP